MKTDQCPTCGSNVKVVGKTTLHYEPTDDWKDVAKEFGFGDGIGARHGNDVLRHVSAMAAEIVDLRDQLAFTEDRAGDTSILADRIIENEREIRRLQEELAHEKDKAEGYEKKIAVMKREHSVWELLELLKENEHLREKLSEECLINSMGGDRELSLMSKLQSEKLYSDKLRKALEKIADPRKRDHKEPDKYTELGCVMHIANEALSLKRPGDV